MLEGCGCTDVNSEVSSDFVKPHAGYSRVVHLGLHDKFILAASVRAATDLPSAVHGVSLPVVAAASNRVKGE